MTDMKPILILKMVAIMAVVGVLPFLGGVAIGKVSELLQTRSNNQSLATTPQLLSQPTSEFATETPTPPNPEPQKTAIEPKVASATTLPNDRPAVTPTSQAKPVATPAPQLPSCSGNLVEKFVCLLNDYRANNGLAAVTLNSGLSQVALGHSTWMNETGTFSHTGPNGSRLTDRCAAAGIRCLAENLAVEIYSADELLSSWQANPGHNKNLLGPYTTIGFGMSGSYVTLLLN